MKLISLLFGLTFGFQALTSSAQPEPMFKGKDVSESALVEALQPPAEALGLTRSLRILPAGKPAEPAKRPSASMLITFETNSADLTPKAREMLDVLGRALQSDKLAQFKFSIEGHADPRGMEEANLRLSQMRAASVVRYLQDHQNISESRLVAIGKGQAELLNSQDPAAPENRRVTVKTIID